jgi:hypothetical protein
VAFVGSGLTLGGGVVGRVVSLAANGMPRPVTGLFAAGELAVALLSGVALRSLDR